MKEPVTTEINISFTQLCPDGRLRPLKEAIDYALEQGCLALVAEADAHFPDTLHTMVFPRQAGFTPHSETQTTDTFPRAVLAGALAEALPQLPQAHYGVMRSLIAQESEHLWAARVPDMHCPFCYFPKLPELPPDADTLAAAMLLLAKTSPERLAELAPAIDSLEADVNVRGWARTWQIADTDPMPARATMNRAIKAHWGDTFDVGVNARVALALAAVGRFSAARKIAQSLIDQQELDGTFIPRWYVGEVLGTALCLTALKQILPSASATTRARHALLSLQRQDGGWGWRRSEPLATAHALWALGADCPRVAFERGASFLLERQRRDGTWNDDPWIAMPIRSKATGTCRVASFGSRSVTTAMCVRALALLFSH